MVGVQCPEYNVTWITSHFVEKANEVASYYERFKDLSLKESKSPRRLKFRIDN